MPINFFQRPNGYTPLRIDESTSGIQIIGFNKVGALESDDTWELMKLDTTIQNKITIVKYAAGSWTDRAILTYK